MTSSAKYNQNHVVTQMMIGRILDHRAGLHLTVEWTPGQAAGTVQEFDRAVAQLRAQIVDAEGEESP